MDTTEKEFKFECTRCGNCCIDKNTLVNVTYSDILRIKQALSLTQGELKHILCFYLYEEANNQEDQEKMVLTPLTTEKGKAYIGILKKPSGACYFYDEENKKCKIYPVRPMICRTFPFSFRLLLNKMDKTKGKIKMYYTEKAKKYCPGITPNAPMIDELEWIKIGKTTLEEMNANAVLLEKWNEAVEKGKIRPTVENFLLTLSNLGDKSKLEKNKSVH